MRSWKTAAAVVSGFIIALACDLPVPRPSPSSPGVITERVLQLVERHFVREIDTRELFEDGIDSMLRAIDRNTRYFAPDEVDAFEQDTEGFFVGVGVVLLPVEEDYPEIQEVIESGPAAAAGVEEGMRLLAVNGFDVRGLVLARVSERIQGPEGSWVHLRVRQEGTPERELQVERRRVVISSVGAVRLYGEEGGPRIGYVRLTQFQPGSAQETEAAVAALARQGAAGVVLDLRGNGGGILEEAVEIAGLFLEEGLLMSTRGRFDLDRPRLYRVEEPGPFPGLPLAILIDGGSASASEVVAAALQDHRRALLVGQESFGKWTVQRLLRLGSEAQNGLLKITTHSFHPPRGVGIRRDENGERLGLQPEVPVATDEETDSALRVWWQGELYKRLNDPLRVDRYPSPAAHEGGNGDPLTDLSLEKAIALLSDVEGFRARLEAPAGVAARSPGSATDPLPEAQAREQ
ncbi:MAG: S41 family peptidase [Planctomycetota bacterium]